MLQPADVLKLQCLQRQGRARGIVKVLATGFLESQFQGLNPSCVTLGGLATSLTANNLAQTLSTSQVPHTEAA